MFVTSIYGQQNRNLLKIVKVGMTVEEMKGTLEGYSFMEEPIANYGIDGESFGISVYYNNEKLFFVWTKYGSDKIHEIVILSSEIEIDGIIKVGSTLKEYLNVNPNAKIELNPINEEWEYAYSLNKFYSVEFHKPNGRKVAEYNDDYSLKKILNVNSTIDRIIIRK